MSQFCFFERDGKSFHACSWLAIYMCVCMMCVVLTCFDFLFFFFWFSWMCLHVMCLFGLCCMHASFVRFWCLFFSLLNDHSLCCLRLSLWPGGVIFHYSFYAHLLRLCWPFVVRLLFCHTPSTQATGVPNGYP